MVGRKKKHKICDKGSQEDRISQLPDPLICDILCHLPTKEAVRTSVLSTKWTNLWQWVPGLDLDSDEFSNNDAFESLAERFFDYHKESWIRKLRLSIHASAGKYFLTSWIDAVTTRRIQHLDVSFDCSSSCAEKIPMSIYTCQTLVHLRLCRAILPANAEFISLPCLKIMHLERIGYLCEATVEKLISCPPLLEDLTIIGFRVGKKDLQVRSKTLKRIDIDQFAQVVIDAPLLQCLRAEVYSTKNFEIINLGFSTKLDIHVVSRNVTFRSSFIRDVLTDISRVRDLVITSVILKRIIRYSELGPLHQFRYLSRFHAKFFKSDLEMLPTILESCPELESLILELVKDYKKKREAKVMFSTVPQCLVSSLKFVELKRLISRYEGEIELVRYFLKNSTVLEKLTYYTKKAMPAFRKEIAAMPRCSSACEVIFL